MRLFVPSPSSAWSGDSPEDEKSFAWLLYSFVQIFPEAFNSDLQGPWKPYDVPYQKIPQRRQGLDSRHSDYYPGLSQPLEMSLRTDCA